MKAERLPAAIHQFRLWDESDFDPIVIQKLRRRAEEREAERVRRRQTSRLPKLILRARKAEQREWQAAQVERLQAEERERVRLESIAADPNYSDEDRRLARIELAGNFRRQERKRA